MTYLELREYDWRKKGAVVVFGGANCEGNAGRFYSPEEFGKTADFTTADMWVNHTHNNDISSVAIPYGTSASFYDYDTWGGESFELVGRNFADNHERV